MKPLPPFPLSKIRADTPGCQHVLHFNNAGSALPTLQCINTVIEHLWLEANIGGYEAADTAIKSIENVYELAAELLGAESSEIAILDSATRAWNMAIHAIDFKAGDRILTSDTEYASNYISYFYLSKTIGVKVNVVPNGENGLISVSALENMLDKQVKLISLTHVPSNNGLVNPAEQVGNIAKKYGIIYLLDACQSVGQMPIDVKKIGCDILTTTGRKFLRAPRGTGLLYIKSKTLHALEPVFLDAHSASINAATNDYQIRNDARKFETWEFNVAAKLGLGAALNYCLAMDPKVFYPYIIFLANFLRESLRCIEGVVINDNGIEKCGIVTFYIQSKSSVEIFQELRRQKINVSVSKNNANPFKAKSHNFTDLLRASIHYYNTVEEVNSFLNALSVVITQKK